MALSSTDATVAAVRRSLEGSRRSHITGALFQASLVACLLVSVIFLVVLLSTVLSAGLGVFADRGLDFLTSDRKSDSELQQLQCPRVG